MLKIRLDAEQIDYEKCAEELLPQMVSKSRSKDEQNEIDRLIDRLGEDIVPLAKKILGYLSVDQLNKLLAGLLDNQQEKFIEGVNRSMAKTFAENVLVIGALSAEDLPGNKMTVYATRVSIDYKELVKSPMFSGNIIGGAAKLAVQLAKPDNIEKKGISLLSSDLVKPLLISTLSKSLNEAGLIMTIRGIGLEADDGTGTSETAAAGGKLPKEVIDPLIDAVAAWLKDSL